ncbi:Hypothetical predicted protein, partial [Xyrichtys novacula]
FSLTGLAAVVSEESFHLPPSFYSLFFLTVKLLYGTDVSKFFSPLCSFTPPPFRSNQCSVPTPPAPTGQVQAIASANNLH